VTTWIALRAAGIGAYVVLFLTVSWGLLGTTGFVIKHVAKQTSIAVHSFLSTVGLILLAAHLSLLYVDAYMPFSVKELFVPTASRFRPVPVAFGVLSMYGVTIVAASSWIRRELPPAFWRRLHLLAVPAFSLALIHGVFSGTDAQRPWMWWGYIGTGSLVLFFVVLRGLTARPPRSRAARPAPATSAVGAAARPDAVQSSP
jgi:methionine sulfoxide reductase heme-binding subunit